MAEEMEKPKGITAGKLAINVQKKLTRAQEKVMQKLGKADETKDTAFEDTVVNFNKQMVEGTKLQKDLRAYLSAVKTMHESSKRLQDCLAEMYEPDWFGKEEVDALVEDTDLLWTDYHQKLVDNSLISMDTYLAQFPDVKARIAKRDRKMTDFDSARHHFASIQKGKKKDEAKIAKPMAVLEKAAPVWAQGIITAHNIAQTNLTRNQAEEELGRAQKVFEEINVELQDELPVLWDSRVGFYVSTFQTVAGLDDKFHREMAKLSQNLNDIMTKLEEQRLAKMGVKTAAAGKSEAANNHNIISESASSISKSPPKQSRPGPPPFRPPPRVAMATKDGKQDNIINLFDDALPDTNPSQQCNAPAVGCLLDMDLDAISAPPTPQTDTPAAAASGAESNAITATNGSSVGAELPVGVLYKVKAMHEYAATDRDELEMKTGDIILVVPCDSPDEQDDGWLYGVQETHWLQNKDLTVKGVFPENFTQRV